MFRPGPKVGCCRLYKRRSPVPDLSNCLGSLHHGTVYMCINAWYPYTIIFVHQDMLVSSVVVLLSSEVSTSSSCFVANSFGGVSSNDIRSSVSGFPVSCGFDDGTSVFISAAISIELSLEVGRGGLGPSLEYSLCRQLPLRTDRTATYKTYGPPSMNRPVRSFLIVSNSILISVCTAYAS